MNVVHRCRFTEWEPSSVLSITIASSGTKFALLRTNGNIEIWTQVVQDTPDSVLTVCENGKRYELSQYLERFNQYSPDAQHIPHDNEDLKNNENYIQLASPAEHPYRYAAMHYLSSQWVCTLTIPGSGKNVISQIVWSYVDPIANPLYYANNSSGDGAIIDRLFTLGSNGRIVEWDLFTSLPKSSTQCHGGAIQCGTVSPSGCQLAVGCRDGTVRIFDISNLENEPSLTKTMGKHNRAIYCIDWLHYAHVSPPPQATSMTAQYRPGTVATGNKRVDSSAWWDPPLLATGGVDGTLRVWNAMTGLCTMKLKSDALRFDVSIAKVKHTEKGRATLKELKATGNGRFAAEKGLRHIKITGIAESETSKAKKQKRDLIAMHQSLRAKGNRQRGGKKGSLFDADADAGDDDSDDEGDNLMDGSDMGDGQDDFDDMLSDEDEDSKYGFTDEDEDDEESAISDEEDVGEMPFGNPNGTDLMNIHKTKRKVVLRRGGRFKTINHLIKLKWVDVESIVCLDQTSSVLVINARTGTINNRFSVSNALTIPTDLAVIPATLHTRSLAHKHNIAYRSKYRYQVHPSNIEPGHEEKLLSSLFSPLLNAPTTANSLTMQSIPVEYVSALKTKQVYVPNPIIYVSGVNGKVIELTGTRSVDFNVIHDLPSSQPLPQIFAHQAKFVSTGLHGAHTHDILSLAISTVNVHDTAQLVLFSSGVDTVVSAYAVHPYNVKDSSAVKTYFQYLRPVRVSQLSDPPQITMSNYTSPWSHHWNIARHQASMKEPEIQKLIEQRVKQHEANVSVAKTVVMKQTLTKTHYRMKFVAGDLQHVPFCTCNQCKVTNIATIVNTNVVLRTLHALHLFKASDDTSYVPKYHFNADQLAKKHTQSSLISYIPMNDAIVRFDSNVDESDKENMFMTTANISAQRLVSLLKKSPTLQYIQNQAPEQPIIACPRGFGVDIYTISNHDVLLVKDSAMYDSETALKCYYNDFNNVLCDLQLYNGTIVLDRNAIISTLLSMYTLRQKQQQMYLDSSSNTNAAIVNTALSAKGSHNDYKRLNHTQALEQEIINQHCNPHLFNDNARIGQWSFVEPAFSLQQHCSATFSSMTPTIESALGKGTDEDANGGNVMTATLQHKNGITDNIFNYPHHNVSMENAGKIHAFAKDIKLTNEANLPNYLLSLRLSLSSVSVTTTTQLSPNASLLLVSDATSIKLFGLSRSSKKNAQKHTIESNKIPFPPYLPTFSQYIRSAMYKVKSSMSDEAEYEFVDDTDLLNSIPEHLCEQYIEEYHYISLFTRLLSDNGCQTATFSPCSSLLAISLTPFASTRNTETSSQDMYDTSSSYAIANNYPYLGTIILIDLVTYSIIGYIQRDQIKFFSHSFGVHLPPMFNINTNTSTTDATKSTSLSVELRKMYKDQYINTLDKTIDLIDLDTRNVVSSSSVTTMITKQDAQMKSLLKKKELFTTNKMDMKDSSDSDSDSQSDSDSNSEDDSDSSSDDDDVTQLMNKNKKQFDIDREVFATSARVLNDQQRNKEYMDKDDDNKPTANDLVITVQFSACGRYLTSLDKNNKIRVYQLLDRFFTPSLSYLHTISPSLSSSSSSTNNQHISSYTVLPTVQDIKQSHLTTSAITTISFDCDEDVTKLHKTEDKSTIIVNNTGNDALINNINVKATLQEFIGPSRIERATKTLDKLFYLFKLHAKEQQNIAKNKSSQQVAKIMTNIWKVINSIVIDSNIAHRTPDGIETSDDADDNKQESIPTILNTMYGIKTTSELLSQARSQLAGLNVLEEDDDEASGKGIKSSNSVKTMMKKAKRDSKGYNPQHLFSELIHIFLSNHDTIQIPSIFFNKDGMKSIASQYKPDTATPMASVPTKKGKAASTPIAPKEKKLEYVHYKPFSLVDFDYDIHPSVSGGYTNGHYFIYDTNNKAYLCYNTTRPQEIFSKEGQYSAESNIQPSLTATITQGKYKDPLLQPKSENYFSQVIPYRDICLFNDANGQNIPLLLHSELQNVFSTAHSTIYRPLLSICDSKYGSSQSSSELTGIGGLLSSFNILFMTTEDCYSLSLPLHRCYPSVFSHIISQTYKQYLYILDILQQCNISLFSAVHSIYKQYCLDYVNFDSAAATKTPTITTPAGKSSLFGGAAQKRKAPVSTEPTVTIAAVDSKAQKMIVYNTVQTQSTNPLKPLDPVLNKPFLFTTCDPADIKAIDVFTTSYFNSIDHNERIALLMSECLSLLQIQRLKPLNKFRPVLFFNFLRPQSTTAIGSTKSFFYWVNDFMLTYFNYYQCQQLYKHSNIAKLQGQKTPESAKLLEEYKKDKKYYLTQNTAPNTTFESKIKTNDCDDGYSSDDEPDLLAQYDVNALHIKQQQIKGKKGGKNPKNVPVPAADELPSSNSNHLMANSIQQFQAGLQPTNVNTVTLNNACVVIETPWINIINKLPARAFQQKWGQM